MSKLLGVDVSKWQGVMDWEKCRNAGAYFAFIRAGSCTYTGGICYTDHQFKNNAKFAPPELPVGYYWYFRPNYSPTVQADYFADLIQDEDWVLPPVLDLETRGGLSPTAVSNASGEFIAQLYQRVNVWPIVYSRSYFLHDRTIDHPLFHECDLWIARYTIKPEPWGNPNDHAKIKPPYWNDWTFWQYVADSDAAVRFGGSGPPNGDDDIDLNWFNGDETTFREYIGAPEPDPYPDDIGVKVDVDGVKYHGHIAKVV